MTYQSTNELTNQSTACLLLPPPFNQDAAERWSLLTAAHLSLVAERGWGRALDGAVGVAGMRDFRRVKCLHTHYAHWLALRGGRERASSSNGSGGSNGGKGTENPIGEWVHELLQAQQEGNPRQQPQQEEEEGKSEGEGSQQPATKT